jgi:hypothetical protein
MHITSETKMMAPEEARFMRDNYEFPWQRSIVKSNVDRLGVEIQEGRFIPGVQIYLAVLPDGRKFILNGNHTLEAISKTGCRVLVTVTETKVRDLNEAGEMYAVFDLQKVRTWGDSMRAITGGEATRFQIKCLAGIRIIEENWGTHQWKINPPRIETVRALQKYDRAIEAYHNCIRSAGRENYKLFQRAPVVAVALATIKYQPSQAPDFWRSAAMDEGLVTGDPEKTLLNYLRFADTSAGRTARILHVRAAALAWNAFWRRDTLRSLKVSNATDFHILGTPWHSARKSAPTGKDAHDARLLRQYVRPGDELHDAA